MNTIYKGSLAGCDSRTLAEAAAKLLIEKLALEVRMFDVTDTTSVTDFYINATGKSFTHVASLADDIVEDFSERGVEALRVEGKRGAGWILVDYGDVIINVFDSESRAFYSFDRLLPADCECDIAPLVSEVDEKFTANKVII